MRRILLGALSAQIFPPKNGSDILRKLPLLETIFMKCQTHFPGKNFTSLSLINHTSLQPFSINRSNCQKIMSSLHNNCLLDVANAISVFLSYHRSEFLLICQIKQYNTI